MLVWIAAIIISVILVLLVKVASFVSSKLFKKKVRDLSTPLNIYSGSYALDKMLQTNNNIEESVAILYERMCIYEPLKYKGDKRISAIIDQYRNYVKGNILDPKAENIPSERINDELNPDYKAYLTAQRKALAAVGADVTWFDKEHQRITKVKSIENITDKFTQGLVQMGMPIELLPCAYSDYRVENWKAADWKRLIKFIREEIELGEVSPEALGAFILHNDNKDILFNREKLIQFHMYLEENVPIPLLNLLTQEKIDEEDMYEIIQLVQEDEYEWSEAIKDVLKEKVDRIEACDLREVYQLAVQKGTKYLPKEAK